MEPRILNPYQLEIYADAIHTKGAALNNCFGFVDGTVRAISRPIENQEITYNGHKRIHALKFQSVTLPNGLIANMYGPVGNAPVNVKPQGGGGGRATHGKLTEHAFPRVGNLTWPPSWKTERNWK